MLGLADGQVHKVVRVVGTSRTSWEAAARAAVSEAGKTIQDLRTATVVEADLVVDANQMAQYRLKLEMNFRLDRSRVKVEAGGVFRVRRYLIVANKTLANPALRELLAERDSAGPSEFHVLVPEEARPIPHLTDPMGLTVVLPATEHEWQLVLQEAEDRLADFQRDLVHLAGRVSGEVRIGDALTATRRVMEYASFDEIILSTAPPGLSRWLNLDLPSRLQRAFNIPVTPLIQTPTE